LSIYRLDIGDFEKIGRDTWDTLRSIREGGMEQMKVDLGLTDQKEGVGTVTGRITVPKEGPPKMQFASLEGVETKGNGRVRAFVVGPPGSGKTPWAICGPDALLIDMEAGAESYTGFTRIPCYEFDALEAIINSLTYKPHKFKTLIVDPCTIAWNSLQRKWSDLFHRRRDPRSAGHMGEFYEFQPHDWITMNADWNRFLTKVCSLDMNVIFTSHQKTKYKDQGFMVKDGVTFDAQKSTDYAFSQILYFRREDDKFIGRCERDRSRIIPTGAEFDIGFENWGAFAKFFKKADLNRAPRQAKMALKKQINELFSLASKCGMSRGQTEDRLADYGVDDVSKIPAEVAEKILVTLRAKVKEVK